MEVIKGRRESRRILRLLGLLALGRGLGVGRIRAESHFCATSRQTGG